MLKEVPIKKVRLGRSTVKTPDLSLMIEKQESKLNCFLEGVTDLQLAILKANNGEALLEGKWGPLTVDRVGNVIKNQTIKPYIQQ
ncbi:hypothetical protein ACBP45_00745 [Latilactobacillus sakei]